MTDVMAFWLALGSALLAIVYGLLTTTWVLSQPAGSEKMQRIAAAIQEGAKAYMNRQYGTIALVGLVMFVVVG
ncbi:MAG: sodium/proton-translocating pyrophosphatase, partial [Gammaproteobacteria bacterium]|nr:sodium/proton-translocating pyrophosphatase [Gammaproteobacteria bacterium]NNK32817.1 sodium-translocating pyrophosphatase [Xanthomonadales bacterium]